MTHLIMTVWLKGAGGAAEFTITIFASFGGFGIKVFVLTRFDKAFGGYGAFGLTITVFCLANGGRGTVILTFF